MRKTRQSRLDQFIPRLDVWFGVEKKSLAWAQAQLQQAGCKIAMPCLSRWWKRREKVLSQERLLKAIVAPSNPVDEDKLWPGLVQYVLFRAKKFPSIQSQFKTAFAELRQAEDLAVEEFNAELKRQGLDL